MTELNLLRALVLLSLALAPLLTHRVLLGPFKRGRAPHALALSCAAVGLFSEAPLLCTVWLSYCVGNLVEFFWRAPRPRVRFSLRSLARLAGAVPLAFSVIAALWLVGGANELHILGYGETFSYYAALHGNVLGWMTVGSIAVLAMQGGPHQKLYLTATFLSFASFLFIAIGIASTPNAAAPTLKPIGVLGLSLALPIAQLAFLRSTWPTHKPAFALGLLSLLGLIFTLILAWQNELGHVSFPPMLGVRPMVSLHGLINGVLVAPCFMLAVAIYNHKVHSGTDVK